MRGTIQLFVLLELQVTSYKYLLSVNGEELTKSKGLGRTTKPRGLYSGTPSLPLRLASYKSMEMEQCTSYSLLSNGLCKAHLAVLRTFERPVWLLASTDGLKSSANGCSVKKRRKNILHHGGPNSLSTRRYWHFKRMLRETAESVCVR